MIATTARFGILFSLLSQSVWAVDLVPASHGNIRGQGPEEESRHLTAWTCSASTMLPAPQACGLEIAAGFYPDETNQSAYCQCTGSLAPGRWEVCPAGLIWKVLPGNSGLCDWPQVTVPPAPTPVVTRPPTPTPTTTPVVTDPPSPTWEPTIYFGTDPPTTTGTDPPTGVPTSSPTEAPAPAWACTRSNFGRNGVGPCGAGIVAGYYPDLDKRNSYCFCTGTTAPSRYQRCQKPLRWDSFPNGSGSYLAGDLDGIAFGQGGLWGTNQGNCNYKGSISKKTKQRPPFKN